MAWPVIAIKQQNVGYVNNKVLDNFPVDTYNKMLPIKRMQLSQWLTENEITSAEFADNIGVSSEAVRLYLCGRRFPRRGVLADISDATKGAVTANDFANMEAGT